MPTDDIQRWYNQRRREEGGRVPCVILSHRDTYTNPADVDDDELYTTVDVNRLTPGRMYEVIIFDDTDYEQRYLYEGVTRSEQYTN